MHIPNSDRPLQFYCLEVIISVGYRVKSNRGVEFRQWANNVLYEKRQKRISEGALVAITLMSAESDPKEKDFIGDLDRESRMCVGSIYAKQSNSCEDPNEQKKEM